MKKAQLIIALLALALGCSGKDEPASPQAGAAVSYAVSAATPTAVPPSPSLTPRPSSLTPAVRDPRWAVPMERPGLPNLHKVNDTLYRGAQPTAEGFRELQKMGIKTVVNLRSMHSDEDEMGDLPLDYVEIPMHAWHPEDEDVAAFLRVVNDPARAPIFVHCQHGADRTGTMCALYRMAVQGWSEDDAIAEMTGGGYGFHAIWGPILKDYLEDMDVEAIKKEAASSSQPAAGS